MAETCGSRVIAATGTNRDVLKRGALVRTKNGIAEIRLDGGKVLCWPTEFVFLETNGEPICCGPV